MSTNRMRVRGLLGWLTERYRHRRHNGSASRGVGDGGMVTVFTALASLALLLMVGLVVDGGDRMRAVGRADRVAGEAARAAVEAADTRGPTLTLDRPAAMAAASSYLRAADVAGTVTVIGQRTVHVEVRVDGTYLILGILGSGRYEVSGSADASLSVGVTSGDAP